MILVELLTFNLLNSCQRQLVKKLIALSGFGEYLLSTTTILIHLSLELNMTCVNNDPIDLIHSFTQGQFEF